MLYATAYFPTMENHLHQGWELHLFRELFSFRNSRNKFRAPFSFREIRGTVPT
jgi:hypothetical protein